MPTLFRGLGRALPAASAILALAACGDSMTATAPSAIQRPTATKAVAPTAAPQQASSVLVRGSVVDLANRPVVNANVECMGSNVKCMGQGIDVGAQDGPDSGVKTDASGAYALVVTQSGGLAGGFLLDANARGFQIVWRQLAVPSATCTPDQPSCTIILNFTLSPQAE